jgi:hypothetical protein
VGLDVNAGIVVVGNVLINNDIGDGARLHLGNTNHGIARNAGRGGLFDGNDVAVYTAGSGSVGLVTAGGAGVVVDTGGTIVAKNLTIGGDEYPDGGGDHRFVDPSDHTG